MMIILGPVFIKNNPFILSGAADVLFFAALIMQKHTHAGYVAEKKSQRLEMLLSAVEVFLFIFVCLQECVCISPGWSVVSPFSSLFLWRLTRDTCIKRIAKGWRFTQD